MYFVCQLFPIEQIWHDFALLLLAENSLAVIYQMLDYVFAVILHVVFNLILTDIILLLIIVKKFLYIKLIVYICTN